MTLHIENVAQLKYLRNVTNQKNYYEINPNFPANVAVPALYLFLYSYNGCFHIFIAAKM